MYLQWPSFVGKGYCTSLLIFTLVSHRALSHVRNIFWQIVARPLIIIIQKTPSNEGRAHWNKLCCALQVAKDIYHNFLCNISECRVATRIATFCCIAGYEHGMLHVWFSWQLAKYCKKNCLIKIRIHTHLIQINPVVAGEILN